ncbi:hypothetical protein EQP59_07310 [Ornithobacterium rhinotracheale]|uniref:Uncharacterized protein n=1 Tax=Ornithobacterium rhinotracheale TaxID=28251 RepID=A0A410JSP0_ORNRH|nr:hypothetical protein [Ornithobacterium rhinotracheale]QAR31153.1 hypothetical protein EQP59_07310 [Ornithobacterium rhinotracheale]
MSKQNLISVVFSSDDLQKIDQALNTIAEVLKGKVHNLSAEERKQFGRIAEQNKLLVNKTKDLMEQYPQLVPAFLDKEEFDRDFSARQAIEKRLLHLEHLTEQLSDTKILLDNDNYSDALIFYRNVRYLSGEDVPGSTIIAKELSQFFPRTRKKNANKPNDSTPEA